MRIVVALGGNALLKRGEPPTMENQRRNVRIAAEALAPIAEAHQLVITHGSGPQMGLLALQGAACAASATFPLDILDAEVEGQIGYLIEQELRNVLSPERHCVTLLTQIEVDPEDPAFGNPTKPIGAFYGRQEAKKLKQERGWSFTRIGEHYRRVVPSPRPRRIFEMDVIEMLVEHGVITICAGGGGIPTIVSDDGRLAGVEAVIDKDFASALLARELTAQAFLMLTDVDGVYAQWDEPQARRFRRISPDGLRCFSFTPGSMGPKVEAAGDFVEATGGTAGIGALKDASAILAGNAGTLITKAATKTEYWD
jgi:carbamate kinase